MYKLDLDAPETRVFSRMLTEQARKNGDTPFLVNDDTSITFAEAEERVLALAGGLAAAGIGAGDRVGLFMHNRPEIVLLALAVNQLRAVWVPISTDYRGEWLRDSLDHSRLALLATDAEGLATLGALKGGVPSLRILTVDAAASSGGEDALSYDELVHHAPLEPAPEAPDSGETCAILWTSGTTGRSKGVMQSYNNWIRPMYEGGAAAYETRAGDVIYCALPLFHSGAWVTSIFRALMEGITVAIETKFSVSRFWERIEKFQATQTFVIGAMGSFLWNAPEAPTDRDTPLRVAGIVPMAPDIWSRFEERFGLQLVRSGLGMSELLGVMSHRADRPEIPVYALGYPFHDLDIRLCDDDGKEVAPGEPGEICARGLKPNVLFNGYFDAPEATAAAYRDGYFLTGDVARIDPETGAYYYLDRKKDVVRFAGRNISTLEVESVVRRHPAVRDVAAFGVATAHLESEHELKLNVVLAPDQTLTAEDLCTFLNENAPYYFVPRYIDFVDALPYTPTNKIQKYRLREEGVTAKTWDREAAGFEVQR